MPNNFTPLPERRWQARLSVLLRLIFRRCVVGTCWIWTGQLDKRGYGRLHTEARRKQFVHNVSYRTFIGPLPDGMEPDHLCRTPACFNPEHLEAVSQPENTRRGRQAKLTHTDVAIIRALDEPHTVTAGFFGVHPSTVCDIRNHRRWNYEGRSS